MTPDLAAIVQRVTSRLPGVEWSQLPVTHAADDDGLWYFCLPKAKYRVQIESSEGVCPFIIETDRHNEQHLAVTVDDVVDTIARWLRE